MAKVSVIVPIFGVEQYIAKCVESLFAQTLDDIEYIFVNDCSPDNSLVILKNIIKKYPHRKPKIKIIDLPENHGVTYARKVGILASEGEYIIHCDSDDWVHPEMYKKMYDYAVDRSLDIVLCDFYYVMGNNVEYPKQANNYNDQQLLLKDSISGVASLSLCNRFVSSDIYKHNIIIYPEVHMLEDSVLSIQIAYYAKTVSYLQLPLYFYRIHNTSRSNLKEHKACVDRWKQAFINNQLIFKFVESKGIGHKFRKEIEYRKYLSRRFLLPIIQDKMQLSVWKNSFPEINNTILFNPYMNRNERFKYIMLILGLYPFLSKL